MLRLEVIEEAVLHVVTVQKAQSLNEANSHTQLSATGAAFGRPNITFYVATDPDGEVCYLVQNNKFISSAKADKCDWLQIDKVLGELPLFADY